MVATIPVRWCSVLALALAATVTAVPARRPRTKPAKPVVRAIPAKPGSLAALVRAFRETPTPARRAAIEKYAAAHTKDLNGSLAQLALGVTAYEQKSFPAAIADLKPLTAKLPEIADYTAYYLGAARVESNDLTSAVEDLAPVHRAEFPSPFSGRAWILEARAFKTTDPGQAVRVLREHYAELPEPVGNLTLADAYQAAGDLPRAADFYQRVYFENVSGDAVARAGAGLMGLQDSMGAAYPPPLPRQMLQRADRYLDAREYREAKREYQALLNQLGGLERDQARVRIGAADYLNGNTAAAYPYLRGLELPESEADAERLYYLEECARKLTDDDEMMGAVKRLDKVYRQSPWRLKALVSAANRFLLENRPDDYVPLYAAASGDFPSDATAATSHWKVAFQAYLADRPDTGALLREHLQRYGTSPTAPAALYFLARTAEMGNDPGSARAYLTRLTAAFANTYYAMLARVRLRRLATAPPSPKAEEFLATLAAPDAKPVPTAAGRDTAWHMERSRLLRTAGLNDLADAELRFGARNGGQGALLAMEMAVSADAPYQALRDMKSLSGDYLDLALEDAPRQFWELLFPLPYRKDVEANARAQGIDPYLLAGLIRQESEFNPEALSRAMAYGLTQVRPGTGRLYARRAGIRRFTNRSLFQPAINLKLGALIFRTMLDQHQGSLEQTLASYNAGPNRVLEWLMWKTYREPAEFVESIPFTETRDYVQAVLRNADIYRRLYR
ncbi:MAG: transglycosylase SLT domain-containing protein [Acidobacteriia bacterium]|nr:transglycosylase SLT domain-containing protein [Terriglobia bacterium]